MSRADPQVNFRIPASLKADLEAAAEQNKRSVTAELIARLEASFAMVIPAAGSSIEAMNRQAADISNQISSLRRVLRGREAGLEQLRSQFDYLTSEGKQMQASAVAAIIEATTAEIVSLERECNELRALQNELDSKLNASMYITDVRER